MKLKYEVGEYKGFPTLTIKDAENEKDRGITFGLRKAKMILAAERSAIEEFIEAAEPLVADKLAEKKAAKAKALREKAEALLKLADEAAAETD